MRFKEHSVPELDLRKKMSQRYEIHFPSPYQNSKKVCFEILELGIFEFGIPETIESLKNVKCRVFLVHYAYMTLSHCED